MENVTIKYRILVASTLFFALFCIVDAQQQADTLTIFFDIDKAFVDENKADLLDKLIADKNAASISILGYTDFLGKTAYNQQLSEKRSANVRHYLIEKGVDHQHIVSIEGKGVHPNSVEKNRKDPSDKGIQEHRMVQVIYTTKPNKSNLPKEKVETPEIINLSEEKLVVNNIITLKHIHFHFATHDIHPESYPALEELYEVMQKISTLKIEIHGHICCFDEGREALTAEGKPLSLSRAQVVRDYLIEKGIDASRLSYKGFGSTRRLYPLERNEYEKSMNRRVEILILER